MSAYIETIILYVVIFLSGSFPVRAEGPAAFSIAGELTRIILYTIPALALIWYLLYKSKPLAEWGIGPPGLKDLPPGLAAFPSLMLIGVMIAFIAPYFSEISPPPGIAAPSTVPGWITLACSCLSAAYLEESFFRLYLLSKREELGLGVSQAALVSALLFSLCHLYEGPWGFLNAALSGAVLAFIFLRYRSLHGIAVAHGLYNMAVYALARFYPA
jgi:membrane protease YdiL (CAAX protease family)